MTWDETLPENDDQVRGFGLVVRSHKTEFAAGMEKHFNWSSDVSNAGLPLSVTVSAGTGNCRAFYGPQSEVSAHRDGALMVTSDTSRLFGLTSVSSTLLASWRAVHLSDSSPVNYGTLVQRGHMLTPIGTSLLTDMSYSTSFGIPYNAAPTVMISAGSNGDCFFALSSVTTGGFTVITHRNGGANMTIRWRSTGTVDL